jgi:hypothetical protein
MPLPSDPKLPWPPKQLDAILPAMGQWSAWWTNSLERLQIAYGGGPTGDTTNFFKSDTGQMKVHSLGPIRWFVGTAPVGPERNTKLPIPMAAEICQASADLLFSDPITVTVGAPITPDAPVDADGDAAEPTATVTPPNPTQDRLDTLLNDYFHSTMAEAAEMCAALGGTYLRVTWDVDTEPDGPFSTAKDADTAIPEFKWGRLQAVTFWSVVRREGKQIYRHLERHELAPNGNGVILHALYMGEDDTLGTRISLTTLPETAAMALNDDLNVEGSIDTQSPGLAVQYVPNQTPNRMWRTDPIGRNLGRSDLDGIEHLLDQLAENMSDWMRARRAARARVMYSKEFTKSAGPGQGTVVIDQETYVPVAYSGMNGGKDAKLSDMVQVLQPSFDPAGYKVTADTLIEQILQMAGYSMQTFGVNPGDAAGQRTATEIEQKERRSLMTRDRKIREWTPALLEHITKLLLIDNTFFNGRNVVTDLTVEFSDGVQESQIKLGEFVQSLYISESASTEERVEILHQDWTEDQKAIEVKRIKAEFAIAQPDAMVPPDFGPVDQSGVTDGNAAA